MNPPSHIHVYTYIIIYIRSIHIIRITAFLPFYAGHVDWMPFWKMKETPKQRCLQSTSTSTFKWKEPPDPKLFDQYTLQFPSLHFFYVFDTTSSTLSHHQSCLLHWFPQASEWFEKFYTFFFKIQVIGGSIGCEFSWFSGSTYLPCFKTDRKTPPSAPGHMAQLEVTTWSGQVCHEANMAGKLAFEDRNR